jgi:anaerobic selenocysteine-containing dehydrogenase
LLGPPAVPDSPPPPPPGPYSLRLVTRRTLYGDATLVQRSPSLARLAPPPALRANPRDLEHLGVADGGRLRVRAPNRASFVVDAVADAGVPRGTVSLPFNAGGEGAADLIDAGAPVVDVLVETP